MRTHKKLEIFFLKLFLRQLATMKSALTCCVTHSWQKDTLRETEFNFVNTE